MARKRERRERGARVGHPSAATLHTAREHIAKQQLAGLYLDDVERVDDGGGHDRGACRGDAAPALRQLRLVLGAPGAIEDCLACGYALVAPFIVLQAARAREREGRACVAMRQAYAHTHTLCAGRSEREGGLLAARSQLS